MHQREFERAIREEVRRLIESQYKKSSRRCPGCDQKFTPYNRAQFFCSRNCYSRYHRIPGMVRKMLKGWD